MLDMLKQESQKKTNSIQEQLAEIYISPTKTKKIPSNNRKLKFPDSLNKKWLSVIIILAIISVASFALLFSTNKIDINITVVKEVKEPAVKTSEIAAAKALPEPAKSVQLKPDILPLHTLEFFGSATMESIQTEDYLYLVNSRGYGWANASIDFTKPVNLSGNALSFSAKGKMGGELLAVTLRDAENRTYQSINAVPGGLGKNWQNITVSTKEAGNWIDLNSISEIKLEFGRLTVHNPIGAIIYIKNIGLKREESQK